MNRRRFVNFSAWALLLTGVGAVGCSQISTSISTSSPISEESLEAFALGDSANLTVSVAASVQDAMKEVKAAYQEVSPSVTITYNFGSSGSLAQQIAQGAPADIFLSASKKWMDELEDKEQILDSSRQDLLQNAMVLIVPQDNRPGATDFKDLEVDKVGIVAIGEPESVPAGRYAKEVLTALNLFEPLQSKLVFGKDVRQVVSYVETGNVDAGLVYATDALMADQAEVIATASPDTHSPIVYPIAVVQDSPNAEAAKAFVDFLSTDTAAAIFREYGFTMAD